jgi:hypothetical protein
MISMISADRSRLAIALGAAAPIVVAGAIASLLLRYPPAQSSFYPRCPIYEYLHLQCPGCGATRAVAALLHGQFVEAMHQNALFTLVLPFCLAYAVLCYGRWLRGKTTQWIQPPPAVLYSALTVAIAFTVLRNLSHLQF